MSDQVRVVVNGATVTVPRGTTIAVAIVEAGAACRSSVSGEARGPLCGMGICFECRATVNGVPHSRTCNRLCEPGMEVGTDG